MSYYDIEGEYDFDQYGYHDIQYDKGGDYEDSSPERSPGYESPSDVEGPGLEFGMGARDWDRIGGKAGPMLSAGKKYLDPRDKAKSEFKKAFRVCNSRENDLETALDKIDKIKNLANLNMPILALASCFYSLYGKSGSVNRKNVTEFIKDHTHNIEPIDLIRYIRYLEK